MSGNTQILGTPGNQGSNNSNPTPKAGGDAGGVTGGQDDEPEEDIPPSQQVWIQAEEDQPVDPKNPPKPRDDGTLPPPKLNYFWKLDTETKAVDDDKWKAIDYALCYMPPSTTASRASDTPPQSPKRQSTPVQRMPAGGDRGRSPSPAKGKRGRDSSNDSTSSKRSKVETEPVLSWDEYLEAERKNPDSPLPSNCIFIGWDRFGRYRQVPADAANEEDWSKTGGENAFSGRNAEGQLMQSRPVKKENAINDADWPHLTGFFNRRFELSQIKASKITDFTKFPYWKPNKNVEWKRDNDQAAQNDGVAFVPKKTGGGPAPPDIKSNAQYVKLSATNEAKNLILEDSSAESRGVSKNGIYVARDVMQQLRTGKYEWAENCFTIPLRQENGRVTYLTVPIKLQNIDWWEKAWKNGVAKQEAKAVRSRNPSGLELLLVVVTNTAGVTKDLLTTLVAKAQSAALIPIRQTVQIVEAKNKAEADELKKKFNRFLSTSPFGDYETWIKEKDYCSYLANYPGYQIPDNIDDIRTAFGKLKPSTEATDLNADFTKKLATQSANARKKFPADYPTDVGAVVSVVSSDTVAQAGVRDARKSVPDQGKQMGGSATDIARAAGWPNPGDRITRKEDVASGINWDAPGVYPAEWLHRIAFSWGSPGGNELASVNTNFIFGSSEANSIMTRYEKIWQRLFLKERSYQREAQKIDPNLPIPPYMGLLTTINTPGTSKLPEYSTDSAKPNLVKTIVWQQDGGKVKKGDTDTAVNPWSWVSSLANLSFSLDYSLQVVNSAVVRNVGRLQTQFFPFQRGFYTRIEYELDWLLLDYWTNRQIEKLTVLPASRDTPETYLLPQPKAARETKDGQKIAATRTTQLVSQDAMVFGSPMIISSSTPAKLPQAAVWCQAISGQPIEAGGVQLNNAAVLTMNDSGLLTKVPLDTDAMSDATSSGQIQAMVSEHPLMDVTPPVQGSQAATVITTIDAPAELQVEDGPNGIPARFVLSGDVLLFGKFREQLYSYYGEPGVGLRQIIRIKPGAFKISDYMPYLIGSELDSVQLDNTQFVYNERNTVTDQAGTWLQTDVVFSGALQPVSNVVKNVFRQEKPLIRVQALLSVDNNWTEPIVPSSFGLRGSIPGMSVKFADLIEFTDLGLSINIGRHREPWPPYNEKIDWGVGFSGSLNLETPNDIAPLVMNYLLSEYAGIMTLIMTLNETSTSHSFFGCTGLHLSNVQFTATFAVGDSPASLVLAASASLELRELSIDMAGHYAKDDWSFFCQLEDFDFASLRDLYEDLFGSTLHVSDHEIVVDNLCFMASSAGIIISGQVSVEGHSCAEASISISQLGVHITGGLEDIHLAKGITLQQAALDIFIGPTSDTTLSGPGTSYRFSISGTVAFGGNDVSASLYLAKDPTSGLTWTVYGSFQGALSLSKIVPELKGTFLDLSLQEACIIASNIDGNSAAGSAIPALFPVVKGVQIAASLDAIPSLDRTMNNTSGPTSGLTLQAMYNEENSSFDLNINLAAPQKVSMKNSAITSGPITLSIEASVTPSLVLTADFFIRVPGQDQPLKFTGGITATIEEAKAFIELKDQWWNDPFGLSKSLRLGPDIALQLGIVYAGPFYPSEVGIAAGLMIGEVSGQAALSVSEAPNDELIMVKVDNLGIQDLVAFASTIFEHNFPKPDDFLRFREVELYLSTGTTIGTTYYQPGASFSCDALVFGKEATIGCAVSKLTKSVSVKGSLEPIDIGPISIRGFQPNTNAQLEIDIGASSQHVLISGKVKIGQLDTALYLNADFLPSVSFELHTELDFSTHLRFTLDAIMRHGSFTSMSGLKSLDFDIHVVFNQDIIDYVIAQVNTQVLAAKMAVNSGIEAAQAKLDDSQVHFNHDLQDAQNRLSDAKTKYDLKVAKVEGNFQAEKTMADLKSKKLQDDVNRTFQTFQAAVSKAQEDLRVANENRTNAIRAAQQKVTDAEQDADAKINSALNNLKKAQGDMQRRFGSALNNLKDAQEKVNRAQSVVNSAQRDVDSAKHDLKHCKWTEKIPKAARVTELGTKLEGARAGLKVATGLLSAAQAIVTGPGYSAADASIKFYQHDLDAARSVTDDTLNSTKTGLQTTINVQNDLVSKAATVLNTVSTAGQELHDSNFAKKALDDFLKAEDKILDGLSTAITELANCTEKVAFDAADAGVKIARANTKDIDIAKSALKYADEGTEGIMDAGDWVVNHTFNILNIKSIEATGDLRGLCQQGTSLQAHIVGTFAEENVDFSVAFYPAQGEEMVKNVFAKLMKDMKDGILNIGKHL